MRNAGGNHRDENRWPSLPLVAPRGARELLWHVGVLLAVVVPLVPPGGILVLAGAVALTWLLRSSPVELAFAALEWALTGLVIAAIFASPWAFISAIFHTFTWSRAPQLGPSLAVVLGICIELSVAALALATLVAFDRRSVDRATVDLRVWQRQQTRRRQLLRAWHGSTNVPEVSR